MSWHHELTTEVEAMFRALTPSMSSLWASETPRETLEWKRTVKAARERQRRHRDRKAIALAESGDLRALRRSESAKRAYQKRGKK